MLIDPLRLDHSRAGSLAYYRLTLSGGKKPSKYCLLGAQLAKLARAQKDLEVLSVGLDFPQFCRLIGYKLILGA